MQLDQTDYKIILESLYQLALLDSNAISDDDIALLNGEDLEQRLLRLRREFGRLERKAGFDD